MVSREVPMTMNYGRGALRFASALGILALGFLGAAEGLTPEAVVRRWPDRPRVTALALIAEYGEPDRYSSEDLLWFKNGPWRRTAVYRDAPEGFLYGKNVLEQSIGYDVPAGALAKLKKFDRSLRFDKAAGELISHAESESLNILALNLAAEIVAGKRTPGEARDFYRKTAEFSEAGKSSPYMSGFLFVLPEGGSSSGKPGTRPAKPTYDGEIQALDPPASSAGGRR
jgi:hypothetical protein